MMYEVKSIRGVEWCFSTEGEAVDYALDLALFYREKITVCRGNKKLLSLTGKARVK